MKRLAVHLPPPYPQISASEPIEEFQTEYAFRQDAKNTDHYAGIGTRNHCGLPDEIYVINPAGMKKGRDFPALNIWRGLKGYY